MVAVLLTGMSGTGKSTALDGLRMHAVEPVDTDDPGWIEVVRRRAAVAGGPDRALLDRPRPCAPGRGRDRREPGTLPEPVRRGRAAHRPDRGAAAAGRGPREPASAGTADDRAAIARDTAEVEPLLRASATHVVDATAPREEVVRVVLGIIASLQDPPGGDPSPGQPTAAPPPCCTPSGRMYGFAAVHPSRTRAAGVGVSRRARSSRRGGCGRAPIRRRASCAPSRRGRRASP